MEKQPKANKQPWSDDFDRSVIAISAGVLGFVVVVGLLILHAIDAQNDLLSPEHIMAMIALPGGFVMYALGHKNGQAIERRKNEDSDETKA